MARQLTGVTGYLNYALGRGHFQNPVTGGFVTEAAHITQTNRFLAPMDQTHTLTGGSLTAMRPPGCGWRARSSSAAARQWVMAVPGTSTHRETADHEDVQSSGGPPRVPGHFTADASVGINLMRDAKRRARLALQIDLENIAE